MTFTRHTPGGPPEKAAPVTLARVARCTKALMSCSYRGKLATYTRGGDGSYMVVQ